MLSFCCSWIVFFVVAPHCLHLVLALPQSVSSTSIPTPVLSSPISSSTNPSFSSKTTCQTNTNSTSPAVPLTSLAERASDFCSQLAGEGMFGNKIVDYRDLGIDISFARSNWDEAGEGEKCTKMDGDECLKGLAELGNDCQSNRDKSAGAMLYGVSTHRTPCGTYGVKVTANTGVAVEAEGKTGRSDTVELMTSAAEARMAAGRWKLCVSLTVLMGFAL